MGITKKGKRKIVIDGRTYFWWGYNEQDQTAFDGAQIKLVAEDQSHMISYGLEQYDGERFVMIDLRHERGGICLNCPKFENTDGIITPSGIRKLVEWCKTKPGDSNIRTFPYSSETIDQNQLLPVYKEILDVLNTDQLLHKL